MFQSVPLWYDYINFVQENDPSVRECSVVGVSKARNLFERALTAAGLHVTEGNKIWEAYREFEQAIYQTIDASDAAVRIPCPFLAHGFDGFTTGPLVHELNIYVYLRKEEC